MTTPPPPQPITRVDYLRRMPTGGTAYEAEQRTTHNEHRDQVALDVIRAQDQQIANLGSWSPAADDDTSRGEADECHHDLPLGEIVCHSCPPPTTDDDTTRLRAGEVERSHEDWGVRYRADVGMISVEVYDDREDAERYREFYGPTGEVVHRVVHVGPWEPALTQVSQPQPAPTPSHPTPEDQP